MLSELTGLMDNMENNMHHNMQTNNVQSDRYVNSGVDVRKDTSNSELR